MNRNFAFIVTLLLLSATVFGLNSNVTDQAQKEVLATDDARIKARTAGDVQTMSKIYSDDYTLVTAEGDVRTKDVQINELRSGQLQFRPVEIVERTVRVYDHTAIVLARERSTIIRNGKDIGGDFRTNRIYVHENDRWELVLTQATRIVSAN